MGSLTFNGTGLLIDNYGLAADWCNKNLPLDEIRETIAPSFRHSRLTNVTRPVLGWHKRPKAKIGQLFHPWGASRWAEFTTLIDKDIIKLLGDPEPTIRGYLKFAADNPDDETDKFELDMYMLPPRNLSEFGGQNNDLMIATFVDIRYFLNMHDAGQMAVTTGTTNWEDLYGALHARITPMSSALTNETVDPKYLKPSGESDLNSYCDAWPLLADAVAFNCGQRIVVDDLTSGSMKAINYDTAKSRFDTNVNYYKQGDNSKHRAGGSLPLNRHAMPASVAVTFPRANGRILVGCQQNHLWGPKNSTQVYTKDVTLTTIDSDVKSFGTRRVYHDTAVAMYDTADSADPSNKTQLDELATQIATDYIKWRKDGIDKVFNGYKWRPDGITDIIIEWSGEDARLRAMSAPWNLEVEELCHGTTVAFAPWGTLSANVSGVIGAGSSMMVNYQGANGGTATGQSVEVFNPFSSPTTASSHLGFVYNSQKCRWELLAGDCPT